MDNKNLQISDKDVTNCVRTRFAPSPTGCLHCGGVRTALYNYFFAKKNGGQFILRIEDTDTDRFVEGAEQYILDTFKWLGIDFDESPFIGGKYGPYRQSERKDIYLPYAEQLVKDGKAYYAFDTKEDLDTVRESSENFCYNFQSRKNLKNSLTLDDSIVKDLLKTSSDYVIRVKYPDTPIDIEFNDLIRGNIKINTATLDDKVIWKKKDELPTYHLANVIDDHLMEITHVIRAEEWIPSTPLHIYLYDSFGWKKPEFSHLALVLGPNSSKLSKRDGDKYGFSVYPLEWLDSKTGKKSSGYKSDGFLPETVINFLAFIGWNPGTEKEVYTLDELVQDFDLSKVSKGGGKFNIDKASWFNGQHLKLKDSAVLFEDFKNILNDRNINMDDVNIIKILDAYKNKVLFLKDILNESDYLFTAPCVYDSKIFKKWNNNSNNHLHSLMNIFHNINWNETDIQMSFEHFVLANNISFGEIAPHLRCAITGKMNGPSIFYIMELIGKTETIDRIKNNKIGHLVTSN